MSISDNLRLWDRASRGFIAEKSGTAGVEAMKSDPDAVGAIEASAMNILAGLHGALKMGGLNDVQIQAVETELAAIERGLGAEIFVSPIAIVLEQKGRVDTATAKNVANVLGLMQLRRAAVAELMGRAAFWAALTSQAADKVVFLSPEEAGPDLQQLVNPADAGREIRIYPGGVSADIAASMNTDGPPQPPAKKPSGPAQKPHFEIPPYIDIGGRRHYPDGSSGPIPPKQ